MHTTSRTCRDCAPPWLTRSRPAAEINAAAAEYRGLLQRDPNIGAAADQSGGAADEPAGARGRRRSISCRVPRRPLPTIRTPSIHLPSCTNGKGAAPTRFIITGKRSTLLRRRVGTRPGPDRCNDLVKLATALLWTGEPAAALAAFDRAVGIAAEPRPRPRPPGLGAVADASDTGSDRIAASRGGRGARLRRGSARDGRHAARSGQDETSPIRLPSGSQNQSARRIGKLFPGRQPGSRKRWKHPPRVMSKNCSTSTPRRSINISSKFYSTADLSCCARRWAGLRFRQWRHGRSPISAAARDFAGR